MSSNKVFNFYSRFESGHRTEYIKFTASQLNGARVKLFAGLFSRKPLLFLMVEECFFIYWLISVVRSIFKLKTVGLVFRAKECTVSNTFKHKLKRFFLKNIKKNQNATSLSIIPFFVCPAIENICDDWIYDFQFCDIDFLYTLTDLVQVKLFVNELNSLANGRKIICAIGKQDESKGFDQFITNYINSESLQKDFSFISGGKISGISDSLITKFEDVGGIIFNKKITDSELVALYEASDFIWACYSPLYDQSSGILGRGLQFNKTVIVRKNSVAESISVNLEASFITMPISSELLFSELNGFTNKELTSSPKLKNNMDKLKCLLGTK
ncbi:hypothetical protein [Paraglaciecola psychrophila]|uniref:Glycosyl transferase family 1 domain-containing protein n=1 Tax=Paraglaciecola psychrophila 170 TaxID=1129794 RepID=K7A973_9ALTE|nr:hypothetical protein [Paraglaciecola psychrophila]AGH43159.1 hypothetical protein C427_1050 [Paraglaciecola psychrophila 170]GAC38837.1 hypothetical protein GPSY_3226 [Paraglaciecola psychrophila 170]